MPAYPATYPAQILLSFGLEDFERAKELRRDLSDRTAFEVAWETDREIAHGDSLQAKTINLVLSSFVIAIVGKTWGPYQEFEIRSAVQMKIPVVGVLVYGNQSPIPPILKSLGIPLVSWGWQDIVPIVNGHAATVEYKLQSDDNPKTSLVLVDFREVAASLTREILKNSHALHSLSPRQFEELVAYLMDRQGYQVTLTQQSRDGGIDIFAVRNSDFGQLLTIVDCKKYSPNRPVGVELVRTMYGTLALERASHAIVATTSRFTDEARKVANSYQYQISLKDHSDILTWIRNDSESLPEVKIEI